MELTTLGKSMVKIFDTSTGLTMVACPANGLSSTVTLKTNSKSNWQTHLRLVHNKGLSVKDQRQTPTGAFSTMKPQVH
jgi:hypothetical protein